MGAVEVDQRVQVDVRDSVAIGEQECFVAEVVADAPYAPAGQGVSPGVDHRDLPRFGPVAVEHHVSAPLAEVERDVRRMQKVVREVVLDDLLLVARADDELVEPLGGESFHDMPQDRPSADLHHRFRFDNRLLADPRAEPAGQNHDLHFESLSHCANERRFLSFSARMTRSLPPTSASGQSMPRSGSSQRIPVSCSGKNFSAHL